jgi:hypothetical protein
MIQIFLLILILLLPVATEAAYKIHLQDGSVISGVGFYEKKGSDVALYFKDGSMWVLEKDIIKIEETESGERYIFPEQEQETQEIVTIVPSGEPAPEETSRMETLRADVEALNKEIREANLEESRLVILINEKLSNKTVWNQYQVRQMENELKPYQDELRAVQKKKIELIERKGSLESEISQLTQR